MNDANEEKRKTLSLEVQLRNAIDGLCPECGSAISEMLTVWEGERDARNRETERRQTEQEQITEHRSI
jgi:hypothetical protein